MKSRVRLKLYIWVPLLLAVGNLALVLALVRDVYFNSVPALQFVALVWGAATAVVAFASTLVPAYRAVKAAITKEPLPDGPPVSVDRVILRVASAIWDVLSRPAPAISISVALIAVDAVGLLIWLQQPEPQPAPSSVIVTGEGDETFIYVADREGGQVLMFRQSDLRGTPIPIPIGTHGNIPGRGQPLDMIELHERNRHLIFVTDVGYDVVHVIDARTNSIVATLPVGRTPNSLAITRDHRRLFVSHEQPAPNGSIFVFRIDKSNPREFAFEKEIPGVNCPEALAVSPRGHRLYLATQCGGGKDPVFIIDSASASVTGSIPNLAVGIDLAISPDGGRLYVGRGDFHAACEGADTNRTGAAISVVDSKTGTTLKTVCLRSGLGPMAITADRRGGYLVVANGGWLTVFDRENLLSDTSPLNDLPVGGVSGIGVSGTSIFAFVPSARQLYLYNLGGLKSH